MVTVNTFSEKGFCPVVHNSIFKCAFITAHPGSACGSIKEMKRHNDSDEVFVLLEGAATLYTCDSLEAEVTVTKLQPRVAYNVEAGTWHYLAVSEDAVVFVAESGSMQAENTQAHSVVEKGLVAEVYCAAVEKQ